MDKFEPAGDFEVVSASHVGYDNPNYSSSNGLDGVLDSFISEFRSLNDLVRAEPKLLYTDTSVENPGEYAIKEIRVSLNGPQVVEFSVETGSVGRCTVGIERKQTVDGVYTPYKTVETGRGVIRIDLGTTLDISDYTYRISVTDGLGKTAITPWRSQDDDSQYQAFLEFRVICSDVLFSSTYENVSSKTVYTTTTSEISYPFVNKYALPCYRLLYYTIVDGASPEPQFTYDNLDMWEVVPMDVDSIDGGVEISTSVSLGVSKFYNDGEQFVSGKYKLYVLAVMANCQQIQNESDFNDCAVSSPLSYTLDMLTDNTVSVQITDGVSDGDKYKDSSYITMKFLPKTNINVLTQKEALLAECTVEYKNKDGDFVNYISTQIVCSHGITSSWGIGKLPINKDTMFNNGGTVDAPIVPFRVTVSCSPKTDSECNKIISVVQFDVEKDIGLGATFVKDGLVCCFDMANENTNYDSVNNVWESSVSNDDTVKYGIRVYNTVSSNGKQHSEEAGSDVLMLNSDAYGLMYRKVQTKGVWGDELSFNPFTVLHFDGVDGMTFETYVKSSCIGNLMAKAISLRDDFVDEAVASPGISIGYDSVRADIEGMSLSSSILENEWSHILITINTDIDVTSQRDLNPYPTVRIYVDGSLVKVQAFSYSDYKTFMTSSEKMPPMSLNCSIDNTSEAVKNFQTALLSSVNALVSNVGDCAVKLIRVYNRALNSDEIFSNYLNSVSSSNQQPIKDRNSDQLISIYFIKNKSVGANDEAFFEDKGLDNSTFSILNTITQKKADPENGIHYGSKTTLANCTMYCNLGSRWIVHKNVDVFLQGTSSLAYPVKNYQIKVYDESPGGSRKKLKILPPFQGSDTGWYTKDYVYTLKCDYMEHSHRNNTPTAGFYQDVVLDNVIAAIRKTTVESIPSEAYSNARRIVEQKDCEKSDGTSETITVRPYRDSINGFPCVVYYDDNSGGTDINNSNYQSGVYRPTGDEVYSGTYMFNVDKEGAQLGFELDSSSDTSNSIATKFNARNYKNKDGESIQMGDSEGNLKALPCVSYEGSANDNNSAAAFLPYTVKYSQAIDAYYTELSNPETNLTIPEPALESGELISKEAFISKVDSGDIRVITARKNGEWSDSNSVIPTKYEYISETLEPRYSYSEDYEDDVDEDTLNRMTYDTIDDTIKWVYENCNDEKSFKRGFSSHFSYEYCMTYFLQMLMFTQVDNAGKNAMFDTWGDGVLYPRPYDMDTQMGLDNSGNDSKLPESELNIELSPSGISGDLPVSSDYGESSEYLPNWQSTTSPNHVRYSESYNTSESFLWKSFGKHYFKEIATTYAYLRDNKIYDVDTICDYVDDKTYRKIGEKFYNADASIKYFAHTENGEYISTYLRCVSGNRRTRYRHFLSQRIAFLDSFFSYSGGDNLKLELRSNTSGSVEIRGSSNYSLLGISVYTSQYIKIVVGSTQATYTMLVTPKDSYEIDGDPYQGALFYIPTTGSDKEILIYGAGNIKTINHMKDLKLSKCDIAPAKKLTTIDVNGANTLKELILGGNKYIQVLDISGTTSLSKSIDVSGCTNLYRLIANNSAVTSISFPLQSTIRELNLENSKITSLSLVNTNNINNSGINLSGCDYLSNIKLYGCKNITSTEGSPFRFNHLSKLSSIEIGDCPGIEYINLSSLKGLSSITITNEATKYLDLSDCAGSVFNGTGLNLISMINLDKLILVGAGNNDTTDDTVIVPGRSNGVDHRFTTLRLNGSKIKRFTANASDTELSYNFDGISVSENGLKISGVESSNSNSSVTKIQNLKYSASNAALFAGCTNLTSLCGCTITLKKSGCSELFRECKKLTGICTATNNNTFSFDVTDSNYCKSADRMFWSCTVMDWNSIWTLSRKLTRVNSISGFLYGCKSESLKVIPKNFFVSPHITDITSCFRNTSFIAVENDTFDEESGNKSDGLLHNLENLANAQMVFENSTSLKFVPRTMLSSNKKLADVQEMFMYCNSLGKEVLSSDLSGTSYTVSDFPSNSNILSTTDDGVFNQENEIKNIRRMFFGCSNLSPTGGIVNFFKRITKLEDASLAFCGCSQIKSISSGIFKNNTSIKKLEGTFASTGVETLPKNLFRDDVSTVRDTHTNLTTMMGLFSNCHSLAGHINSEFFVCCPNVTNIGCSGSGAVDSLQSGGTALLGMFSNTKITSCHKDALKPLTKLKDCSMLFYNGETSRTQSGKYVPKDILTTEPSDTMFGFTDDDVVEDSTIDPSIMPIDFIRTNTDLEYTKLMFAGRSFLTGFECDDVKNESILTGLIKLKDASGMFARCSGLSDGCPTYLFKGLSSLSRIDSIFAECSNFSMPISEETFNGCTRLSSCTMAFAYTGVTGQSGKVWSEYSQAPTELDIDCAIPAELFNSCRGALSNVSYMFAGCKKLCGSIGTGYAVINTLSSMELSYDDYITTVLKNMYYDFNSLLASNDVYNSEETDEETKDEIRNEILSGIWSSKGFESPIISELKQTPTPTDIAVMRSSVNSEGYTGSVNTFDTYRMTTKVVTVQQPGLLSDCVNLSSVEGMFYACENLTGPVPADMFYGGQLRGVTSLKRLFFHCYSLTMNSYKNTDSAVKTFNGTGTVADTDGNRIVNSGGGNYGEVYPQIYIEQVDENTQTQLVVDGGITTDLDSGRHYFVPEDWVSNLPNISNIDEMFCQVGCGYGNFATDIYNSKNSVGKLSYLTLPNGMFNSQSKISSAVHSFSYCVSLGRTEIRSNFLSKSLGTLTNISRIFAGSEIKSVGVTGDEFLKKSSKNQKLTTVTYAFSNANKIPFSESNYMQTDIDLECTDASGLTGVAVDFEDTTKFTAITTSGKRGAFRSQTNVHPYNTDREKYDAYINSESAAYLGEKQSEITNLWATVTGGVPV